LPGGLFAFCGKVGTEFAVREPVKTKTMENAKDANDAKEKRGGCCASLAER